MFTSHNISTVQEAKLNSNNARYNRLNSKYEHQLERSNFHNQLFLYYIKKIIDKDQSL